MPKDKYVQEKQSRLLQVLLMPEKVKGRAVAVGLSGGGNIAKRVIWIGCMLSVFAFQSAVLGEPSPGPFVADNLDLPLWHSVVSLGFPEYDVVVADRRVALHHFDVSCESCHNDVENGAAGDVDANQACSLAGCHDYNPVLNHPVGVSVPDAVVCDLPLGVGGEITCLTCHQLPDRTDGPIITDGEVMMWTPLEDDLCVLCHRRMPGDSAGRYHWSFSNKAHLGAINPESKPNSAVQFSSGWGIDDESNACLSCHDDISVTVPLEGETPQEKALRWSRMSNHAIGMDYRNTAVRESHAFNYPLAGEAIRFFDGKVGCGSCHSLYSRQSYYLVMENGQSELCKSCHYR